jgi:hypothetical protein
VEHCLACEADSVGAVERWAFFIARAICLRRFKTQRRLDVARNTLAQLCFPSRSADDSRQHGVATPSASQARQRSTGGDPFQRFALSLEFFKRNRCFALNSYIKSLIKLIN